MSNRLHPGARPDCPDCRGRGFLVQAGVVLAEAIRCPCVGACPECRGTGFVAMSGEFRARRRRCACHAFERRVSLFNESHIPARHAASSLKAYKINKSRMAWFKPVNQYIKDFRPKDLNRGVVLHGDVGRGKTHLMVAVLQQLVFQYGVSVRFVEFSHLLADLKSGFDRGEGPSKVMEPLTHVQVLAIDELGKGRKTEFEGTILDELVSRRYNTAATIIATTNYAPVTRPPPRLASTTGFTTERDTLYDRVGDRVFSRLQEMCDFVEVGGEDYRVLKRVGAS